MNDTFAKLIEMARTGSTFLAAQAYTTITGVSLDTAKLIMGDIRKQTNWTRKDAKEDEQEGNQHSDSA